MAWQETFRDKLISAERAAGLVQDGQTVVIGFITSEPKTITAALSKREGQLRDVTVYTHLAINPNEWYNPNLTSQSFQLISGYLSPLSRPKYAQKQIDFDVWTVYTSRRGLDGDRSAGQTRPDVFFGMVSPPDRNGFCSFGEQLWFHKQLIQNAKLSVCEVNPRFIRTPGDNYIHISEIDFLVEQPEASPPTPMMRQVPEESIETAQVIGALAASMINDGDTIQIGFGLISGATAAFLDEKNDLGVQTEIVPAGLMKLIRQGNVTGKCKQIDTGKVITTALFVEPDDLPYADQNPEIVFRDCYYTNDPRILSQNDNYVTINNALAIDLTGQLTCEAFGPEIFSGVGGQLDFQIGAMYAKNGRAITVLPSTARGGSVSRIVPQFEAGQVVSVPRTFVDYVITEHGIASLQGKSQRQRAEALIEIADPQFRAELRSAARKLFWP